MSHSFLIGCSAALISSSAWALGSVLWRKIGNKLTPESMNLFKGIIGCLYLLIPSLLIGIQNIDFRSFVFLSLSGVIGISFGDTFFFKALINLGPRKTSLMGTLTPGITAIAAAFILRETLPLMIWSGIFITIAGIFWVLAERIPENGGHNGGTQCIVSHHCGFKFCLLSILCNSISIILAKAGLINLPAAPAALIRLFFGTLGLFLWGYATGKINNWALPINDRFLMGRVMTAVFVGVFGGFWLSLYALKHIDTAIASTLGSTSPLFILPISALLLKEKITLNACAGAVLAVLGVALIILTQAGS